MSRPEPGELISGKYRIVRLIGDGGMGTVYEARHEVLGTSVALKFLHAELARRQGLGQRFLQEARVSATLQSPHVTRVTDVDTAQDGSPYLVMELLSGESLQALLDRKGKLERDPALDFTLQILSGLEAAHATGVVHRDVKPDNVFVTPASGGPLLKLIDFGIAKLRASSEFTKGLTRAGVVMGTPEYMAPEQLFSAKEADHRADLYSVGVMLFEMLSGLRPADGEDADAIIAAVELGRVRHLSELDPSLPEGLVQVVEKATQPDREKRFASAGEFRLALAEFARALSPAGRLAASAEVLPPQSKGPMFGDYSPSMLPHNPRTVPSDGPPLSVSQLGAARTSLSEAAPPFSSVGPMAPVPTAVVSFPPAAALPNITQPHPAAPPQRRKRSGALFVAFGLAIVGAAVAVGYGAYYSSGNRRVSPPPLPNTNVAGGPVSVTPLPTLPASPVEAAPGVVTSKPDPPARPPSDAGPSRPQAPAGSAPPPFQLPFPLPSNLVLPSAFPTALPSGLQLPSGFPSPFPPPTSATPQSPQNPQSPRPRKPPSGRPLQGEK